MGFFRRILGRGGEEEYEEYEEYGEGEEYYEPVPGEEYGPDIMEKPIAVKPVYLRDVSDIGQVLTEINENNIVIVRYDDLVDKSEEELRLALRQLKDRVQEVGGEVVVVRTETFPPLLVVPRFVAVWKRPED